MRTSKTLRILTTLAVLIIFAVYFLLNLEKFRPLLHVNVVLLVFIAIGDFAAIAINGLFTKFILQPFGKHIPIGESFYVSLISSVGNFFAPVGAGFGFRAVYLKRKFGLPYSSYISTLSGNYILVFLVDSIFGLVSLYMLRSHSSHKEYGVLVAVFSVIFLVSLVMSVVKIRVGSADRFRNPYVRRIMTILHQILQGWNHIISHKKLMLRLVFLTFSGLALIAVITWLIIRALHLSVPFAPLVLFSVLSSLSLFINITPANLGVKEAIYLFSSTVLGFSVPQILSIALIDRGVLFLVLLLAWASSSRMRQAAASEQPPSAGWSKMGL